MNMVPNLPDSSYPLSFFIKAVKKNLNLKMERTVKINEAISDDFMSELSSYVHSD